MKKKLLVIPAFVVSLMFVLAPVYSQTVISSCQTITTSGNYELNQSISNTIGKCLKVDVGNVQIDCKGFGVSIPNVALDSQGVVFDVLLNNLTVMNCAFDSTGGGLNPIGIITNMENDDIFIINNTFDDLVDGIFQGGGEESQNWVISNNTFFNITDDAIALYSPDGNIISNNTFTSEVFDVFHYENHLGSTIFDLIFNNKFNHISQLITVDTATNSTLGIFWNVTKQVGNRIFGEGTEIGGNWYENSTDTLSLSCLDIDQNGFCDEPFSHNVTVSAPVIITDFLPLSNNFSATPPDTTPPVITVNQPTNTTFSTSSIVVEVLIDEAGSVDRSLDGGANVTLTNSSGNWNEIIGSVADGGHSITIFATDTAGNEATPVTVFFTVDTSAPPVAASTVNPVIPLLIQMALIFTALGSVAGVFLLQIKQGRMDVGLMVGIIILSIIIISLSGVISDFFA